MVKFALRCLVFIIVVRTSVAMAQNKKHVELMIRDILPPHVGACVLVIDHGKEVAEYADGLADIESKVRCTPETNFRLASVSKQFTAAAVLLLVDRGDLSLEDKLLDFFPGFPEYGRKITVKHLLTHTSGLPAYEGLIPPGTKLQLDDYDVLHLLMDTKTPRFAAGEKYEYSNSGYALLGLIVEAVADQPFHAFLASEVFRPLGMERTVLYQRGLNEVSNRAYGHELREGKWERADQSLTSAVRGDGGVYTSLRDYRRWLEAVDERKLLSRESYGAMFSPQVKTDRDGSHYGYGWFVDRYRGEQRIHHNGDTQGFRLCVQRFPNRKAGLLIQLNSEVEGDRMTAIGERLADALLFDRER